MPAHPNLFLVGDAASVVEPFTGEGIYYALASGELAAEHLQKAQRGEGDIQDYRRAHAGLYCGRLWINRLAREAMIHPLLGDAILNASQWYPGLLGILTRRVLGSA